MISNKVKKMILTVIKQKLKQKYFEEHMYDICLAFFYFIQFLSISEYFIKVKLTYFLSPSVAI